VRPQPDEAARTARGRAAAAALAAFAVDPFGLGGVVLRGGAASAREDWLAALRTSLPAPAPLRRVPVTVADDRLLGGLDLAATLSSGRAVLQRGLLAELDGGVAVFPMAERLPRATAQRLAAVLDTGVVRIEREGFSAQLPARTAVVLLDESLEPEEGVSPALSGRLAFWLDADLPAGLAALTDEDIRSARERLAVVTIGQESLAALVATADAFGITGVRAPLLALRAARVFAALDGDTEVSEDSLALAAELVLAPRATRLPAAPATPENGEAAGGEASGDEGAGQSGESQGESRRDLQEPSETPKNEGAPAAAGALPDRLVEATRAALPPALLAALASEAAARGRAVPAGGRAGDLKESLLRGRPLPSRAGMPRAGARLDLLATLRAAAPWQRVRRSAAPARRLAVESSDLRIRRFRERGTTLTIFAVDASGSTALHRFGEAKGAVQLLLGDCYVRRDEVAVVTFRGAAANLAVPPTRSLVRARRCLEGIAGGGGTPLAAGLRAALEVALNARRRGATATLVILSDGNANVGLAGLGGRAVAEADAHAMARQIAAAGIRVLFIDTAPRPREAAARLATVLAGRYLPLPYASAGAVHRAVSGLVGNGAP
jgi:magnesium chelatase subunit D